MSLWKRYAEAVGEPDDLALRRLERRVVDRVEATVAPPRRTWWLAAAGVLAAVLLAVVLLPWGSAPDPASVSISTTTRAQQVSLPHDGVLWVGVESHVEIAASDASGAVVRLHEGEVTLHVQSGEGLRWRVEVDDHAVEAVGTRFTVRRTEAAPEVHVDEGVVRLTGPGQPEAGMLVRAVDSAPSLASATPLPASAAPSPASATAASATPVSEADEPAVPADEVDARDREDAEAPEVVGSRKATAWIPRFRSAIETGDDAAAVAALPDGFPTGREPLTAADFLDAGDALASRRDAARADAAYRAACRRSDAPACGVATFRRALLASRRNDPQEAIRLATVYLDEHPDGSLAREVLGRRMRWQSVHGSASAAREDARDYLARWPAGPHADLAHRIVDAR